MTRRMWRPRQGAIVMRRQVPQDEIERLAPPSRPQLARADELLGESASFGDGEEDPAERHRLLATLFECAW